MCSFDKNKLKINGQKIHFRYETQYRYPDEGRSEYAE